MADCSLGWVYLLHLAEPMGRSQHYVGWAKDLEQRIESHFETGERHRCVFTWEARNRGIEMWVVRIWQGPIELEKYLKRRRHHKQYCPVCSGPDARDVPQRLLSMTSPPPGIWLTK